MKVIMVFAWIHVMTISVNAQDSGVIQVNSNRTIHFVVKNPKGLRTGIDPRGFEEPMVGRRFEEIPRANYATSTLGDSPVNEEPQEEDFSHEFLYEMFTPDDDGVYEIDCIGTKLGLFTLTIVLTPERDALMQTFWANVRSVIDKDYVVTYRFEYYGQLGSPVRFEKLISVSTLRQDLDTCFKLGLFKNKGIYTSLRQKAENAIRQHERGQKKAAVNLLQAFVQELQAQTDKGIDKDAAENLLEDAQALIKEWS